MVTCQYCGHDTTQPGATYCSYCGSSLSQSQPSTPAPVSTAASQPLPAQSGYTVQRTSTTDVSARYEKALKRVEQQVTIVLILSIVTVVLALI